MDETLDMCFYFVTFPFTLIQYVYLNINLPPKNHIIIAMVERENWKPMRHFLLTTFQMNEMINEVKG